MERPSIFTEIEQRVMQRGSFNLSIVHTIEIMSLEHFKHEKKFKFIRTFLEDISEQTNVSTYSEWRQAKKFAKFECAECKREQEAHRALPKGWRERNEVTPSGHVFHGDDLIAL